jgi:polyphosphate glucokinase
MKNRRVLVIDVGGTNIKIALPGRRTPIKVPSGPEMTAAKMAAAVKKVAAGTRFDVVSIGYPGPVVNGRPSAEPRNLGAGWRRFDYRRAFGRPVRIINDAAMQALGSYQGGRMLFLGLGTGLGSALVANGELTPLELAHLPYRRNRTYEDYAGTRGLKRLGAHRWTNHVAEIAALLQYGLQVDYVVLGGGQTKKLKKIPPGTRLGDNSHAIIGGLRVWERFGDLDAPSVRERRGRTAKRARRSP